MKLLLVGLVSLLCLCGRADYTAGPYRIRDFALPAGWTLAGGVDPTYPFIGDNGVHYFMMKVVGGGIYGLYCYNDDNSTNSFIQPLTTINQVNSRILTHCLVNNTNLIIAGLQPSAAALNIFEFNLVGSPVPTSAVLKTNFLLATIPGLDADALTMTAMQDGGVCLMTGNGAANFIYNPFYRTPGGVWTNMPQIDMGGGSGLPSTFLTSAEMLSDGSWWTFGTKDGFGAIRAVVFVTNGLGGITVKTNFVPVNDLQMPLGTYVWGFLAPYGEICDIQATSDTVSNRVFVTYNDSIYTRGNPDPDNRTLFLATLGMLPTTNFYQYAVSSNQLTRFGSSFSSQQIGTNFYMLYPQWSTNGESLPYPIFIQKYSAGISGPPIALPGLGTIAPIGYHPHRLDYAVQLPDQTWHLWLLQPQTFFVDPVTGNDSNAGSQDQPWAHLPGSLNGTVTNILTDGASVIVKGGTTNFSRVEVGSNYVGAASYNSILIQSGDLFSPAWGSGRAIIDGGTTNTAGFALGGGLSSGVLSGITIDGFEVRNIAAGAAGNGYDNSSGSSCILAGGSVHPANWLTIKRCYLHDAARSIDNTGHGIEFAGYNTNFLVIQNIIGPNIGTKGIEPFRASFGAITNNYISGCGDHCVSFNATTNVDCGFNVINNNPPYVHEPQYGISVADGRNLDVFDNLIYRSVFPVTNTVVGRSGMGIGVYGISISNRFALNTIAFFNDPANSGAAQSAISEKAASTNSWTEYYNNLVFSNYNAAGPFGFTADTASSLSNRMAFCDVFANNATEQVMATETANVDTGFTVAAYNPTFGIFTNNQQLNPSFQAGTLPSGLDSNYRPNAGYFVLSHAAPVQIWKTQNTNTGDLVHGYDHSAGKFARDINGIQRTVWSMGAYELDQGNVVPYTNVAVFISGKVFVGGKVLIGSSAPDVLVVHANGSSTVYDSSAKTELSRGSSLTNAFGHKAAGDTMYLSGGTFDCLTNALALNTAVTGVSIIGAGKSNTVIKTSSTGVYVFIRLGNASTVSDLSIIANPVLPTTDTVPIGSFGESPYTNAVMHNLYINGTADCVFCWGTNCSAQISGCTFVSHYDCYNMDGVGSVFAITACDSTSTANADFPGYGNGMTVGDCIVNATNCTTHGSAGSIQNAGFWMGGAGTINIRGGSATSSGTGAFDLLNTSTGAINYNSALVFTTKFGPNINLVP